MTEATGILLPADAVGLARAAEIIRAGGLVAFPTETVYGLGADGLNGEAVARIFAAKGRPADNPLILHVASDGELSALVARMPEEAAALTARFWPGPLTLVLPRSARVPENVTAGLETVAVRMPDHPVALALIRAADRPLAAPSANRSGSPSPTTAAHVFADLGEAAGAILDGGACRVGVESTVLDLSVSPARILRPGAVTSEMLAESLGYAPAWIADARAGGSPGLRHRHYQPRCAVVPFTGFPPELGPEDGIVTLSQPAPAARLSLRVRSLEEYAQRLYAIFRRADQLHVARLFVERPPLHGLGAALTDRIRRAAGRPVDG